LPLSRVAARIPLPLQFDPGAFQRRKKFKNALSGAARALELIGSNNHRHRFAVSGDGLRAFSAREFDHVTELVLCIREWPCFHRENFDEETRGGKRLRDDRNRDGSAAFTLQRRSRWGSATDKIEIVAAAHVSAA